MVRIKQQRNLQGHRNHIFTILLSTCKIDCEKFGPEFRQLIKTQKVARIGIESLYSSILPISHKQGSFVCAQFNIMWNIEFLWWWIDRTEWIVVISANMTDILSISGETNNPRITISISHEKTPIAGNSNSSRLAKMTSIMAGFEFFTCGKN